MFTQKLREINQPTTREQQSFITIAKVIEADESNNCCTVKFTNNMGKQITTNGVPYQIVDPKVSSFFPSKNDLVYMQCHDNKNYLITGPYYKYDNMSRNGHYKNDNNKMYFKDYDVSEGNIL